MENTEIPKDIKDTVVTLEDGSALVTIGDPTSLQIAVAEIANLAASAKSDKAKSYISPRDKRTKITGAEWLQQIGQLVVEEYKVDLASREEWLKGTAEDLKLFTSFMEPKSWPWPNASNINVPFISMAVLQFQARAIDNLIPSKDIVQTVPFGDSDISRAERVKFYMNWQLHYGMEEFEEGMDKTTMQCPLVGCVFRKTYYDHLRKQVQTDFVSASDFVVNYGATYLERADRYTHKIRMSQNNLRKRARAGVFLSDAWALGPGNHESVANDELQEASDQVLGLVQPQSTSETADGNLRLILEQHRYLDIDHDGIDEPVVVTVDYETGKVLRIVSRRYLDRYGKEQTFDYFTKYDFIPNPEGFYGLGYGILLRNLNHSANTLINEIMDAGALANMQGGFISKRSGIKRGQLTYTMGEYKEIDTYVDDLRKAIFTLDFKGPDQTLFATLGLLFEYSKLVSSVSEISTGQLPASDTPASTVLALIEEGRKVYSSIHKRMHRSLKKELKKVAVLNSVFLDEGRYMELLENLLKKLSDAELKTVGKADFAPGVDVVPVSDANITSNAEKMIKAQELMKDVMTNPLHAGNNNALFQATSRYYDALGVEKPEEILAPPPPPQDVPPVEENSIILRDGTVTVIPEQDHIGHMSVHEELQSGPFSEHLTPIGKSTLERHLQEHVSALYLQQNGGEDVSQSGSNALV